MPKIPKPSTNGHAHGSSPEKEKGLADGNSLIDLILSPPELGKAAYMGFVGEFLGAVSEYTEATDVGVLAHLLPAVGTYIGPNPYVWGGGWQRARINTVLVGPTSVGRKGTSQVGVDMLLRETDAAFWDMQQIGGLATGEGLINKVADKKTTDKDGNEKIIKVDKRVYVIESEFSKVLAQIKRPDNILGEVVRQISDNNGDVGVYTKVNPLRADKTHISITGHITPEELAARFNEVEMANGFGNRFLWFFVKSDKVISNDEPIPSRIMIDFAKTLRTIQHKADRIERIQRNKQAQELWDHIYPTLREDRPGLTGAMVARGTSFVLRLALLYALMDRSKAISVKHLQAALAVWEYSEASTMKLFRSKTGSALTDKIYQLLERGPMRKTDFHSHGNYKSGELDQALNSLKRSGHIRQLDEPASGRGRPTQTWERTSTRKN